jgi:Plasma-membrane choline transporter
METEYTTEKELLRSIPPRKYSVRLALLTISAILFAFILGISTVFSYTYVWLARLFPTAFIWITGILNIVFGFVLAIWMLIRKDYAGGVIFLIFAVFTVFCFFTWIPRIPFSAFMLRTSIDVSKRYGHTYWVSFIGGLIGVAFAAWYSLTVVAIYAKWDLSNDRATVTGLIVFVTFAMYWISEVIKNVIHATIAGVYGSWFFCSHNMPKGATRGALKRTLTYSFGSISLGSLIVAIINGLRQLCSIAQSDAQAQGNILGQIAFCILQCFIGLLDWAVQFINRYAFVTIALYGKSYFAAARDTWTYVHFTH